MSLDLPKYQHVSQDQWDGYAAERREILEHFLAKGVTNLTALTGDIHTFFAGDMTTTGNVDGTPVGVELVGGSATSLGIPEYLGVPSSTLEDLRVGERPARQVRRLRPPRATAWSRSPRASSACEFFAVDALTRGAAADAAGELRDPVRARGRSRCLSAQPSEEICEPEPPAWSPP